MQLHLTNGKTFTVLAPNVNKKNIYIQSTKVNGHPYDKTYITHEQIMSGATVEFEMGSTPKNNRSHIRRKTALSISELISIERMNENFDVTYKALFRKYYPSLIFYATRLIGEEEAEDVVQDVFVELWRRKDSIEIGDQIQAFLYRAVYTRALNVLKHRNVEDGYCAAMEEINQRRAEFYQPDNNEVIRRIEDRELRKEIYNAINELPDKCKEVFKLSYLHEMKNKEIADVLGISLRTVEAHMYKALKYLRSRLDRFG